MKIQSTVLKLEGLRFYAYHGVMEQEKTVGTEYLVNLTIENVGFNAIQSDNLQDTVNYALIIETVKKEMSHPSALIEHVAGRIAGALLDRFDTIQAGSVTITKVHPPVSAAMAGASFSLSFTRN